MYYEKLSSLGIKLRRRSGQEKTTCPQCSESRRNKKDPCLSVNITEGKYNCHNCGFKGDVRVFEQKAKAREYQKPNQSMLKAIERSDKMKAWFANRGISEKTLEKFFIHIKREWMPQTQAEENCIVFPYIRNGEIINAKFRDGRKNFKMVKDAELIFYGMQTLVGRHCAVIVEGELDALALYEAGFANDYEQTPDENGEVVEHELGRWAILSVPNGASRGSQRLEYLDNCADELSGIDEFIIAVDGDEAGGELKNELIRRLGAEKCRFIEYPVVTPSQKLKPRNGSVKDCNEILQYFDIPTLRNVILDAQAIPVQGIYYVEDVFKSMYENFKKGVQLAPTTRFGEFDSYFRWKKGEVNLFTGYSNYGKTFFVLQLMLTKSIFDGWKWAVFSPENYPANDFYDDLVEMYCGKFLNKINEEEYLNACAFLNDHIFFVYPDEDHNIESIHEKFRYLILKKGVDGVLIDPFNQLDKTQRPYERDDQYLSVVFKDIKRFALLNGISYNIIAHPKTPTYGQNKELPIPDIYDLHGGAMWANKMDNIVSYHRPNFYIDKTDPNVSVYVQKVKRKRTGGQHGEFAIRLIWSQKRYCDMFDNIFCDPEKAKRVKFQEENGILPESDKRILQSFVSFNNNLEDRSIQTNDNDENPF